MSQDDIETIVPNPIVAHALLVLSQDSESTDHSMAEGMPLTNTIAGDEYIHKLTQWFSSLFAEKYKLYDLDQDSFIAQEIGTLLGKTTLEVIRFIGLERIKLYTPEFTVYKRPTDLYRRPLKGTYTVISSRKRFFTAVCVIHGWEGRIEIRLGDYNEAEESRLIGPNDDNYIKLEL